MKMALLISCFLVASTSHAQYYYKDIVGTKESSELIRTYKKAGVKSVRVTSYDEENTRIEDLSVEQTFSNTHAVLRTITRSGATNASILTSYTDDSGRVVKTVDSTLALISTTEYTYTTDGKLAAIKSNSSDSFKRLNETEAHYWQYNGNQILRMLRVKNNADTTVVDFKTDNGNIVEEQSTRRGVREEPVYYYYNAAKQLTDIVRFNAKAKRLLPEYMFEFSAEGRLLQKITVPANGSQYLIWRYQYDASGLKIKEAIYDRNKALNGKVEYTYERT